jgi:hypothetical protein
LTTPEIGKNSAPRQWQVLSLVPFFGPAKKGTRLPAGTGEVDFEVTRLPAGTGEFDLKLSRGQIKRVPDYKFRRPYGYGE